MRKTPIFAIALSAALLASCTLDDILGTPGTLGAEDEVVRGLRTALSLGIDSGASLAGRVDGYLARAAIRIVLPPEAEEAVSAAEEAGASVGPFARQLQGLTSAAGLSDFDQSEFGANLARASSLINAAASLDHLSDSLIKYMNRAAEYAAPRSVPIFKSAILSMSIPDGLSLLNSADSTAATAYLNGRTFRPLTDAYAPLVDSTLTLVPLTRYWNDFRTTYNGMLSDYRTLESFQAKWNGNAAVAAFPSMRLNALPPLRYQAIQTESLGQWTTGKALAGLFWLVGEQEKAIRRDPIGYVRGLTGDVADLLKEVFGDIMEMGSKNGP